MNKNDDLRQMYDLIEKPRKRYGRLRKCEFHLHTPASHDYQFTKDKLFSELSIEEVIEVSAEMGCLNKEVKDSLLVNIEKYQGKKYVNDLKQKGVPYSGLKEYIAYKTIAYKLYKEEVEVVVVSDHNNLAGFKKLAYALEEYYVEQIKGVEKDKRGCIYTFLGVEISCSDKNHVVIIYDNNRIDELEDYLGEIILTEEYGTFLDSRSIIESISQRGGIAYLAHLNSSEWLGSGAYKQKLYSMEELKLIGIKDFRQKDSVIHQLRSYIDNPEEQFSFINEGDAHNIQDIGINNTWVKFNKIDFQSLNKAIDNRNISIYAQKLKKSNKFIKGIVSIPGEHGFLNNKDNRISFANKIEDIFSVYFSRDLNCIIGGRGTGKSTLLQTMEIIYSRETDDKRMLEFISQNKIIYSVFYLDGCDYILRFIPQTGNKDEYYYLKDIFLPGSVKEVDGQYKLSQHWIELYKINNDNFIRIKDSKADYILSKIFRRGYNINELVEKINSGNIGQFIRRTVTYGINYDDVDSYVYEMKETKNRSFPKYLREHLREIIRFLDLRKERIYNQIDSFNKNNKDLIEIVYSPKRKEVNFYLNDLLSGIEGTAYVENTYLNWNGVQSFIYNAVKEIGYLEFLCYLFNGEYNKIEQHVKLKSFVDKNSLTFGQVELELKDITDNNKDEVYQSIYKRIIANRMKLEDSIIKCFKVIDDFTINFNINSRESVRNEPCVMKNIEELSLGQKVIALLTFVFKFGVSVDDNTPLIIDQPEDNLDNQYIYKNLVKSLREIKNSRQVIIATHSSTIVTNADAEEVIVMNSDNNNGWIEKIGYPSEKVIIKHIVNYMEGGETSFKHKVKTYELFLKDLRA